MEKAEALYRKSIDKQKDDADVARRELVNMKVDLGRKQVKSDPAKAEQLYREALALDSASDPAKDGLGRALNAQGRVEEAISVLSGQSEFGACDLCGRYLSVILLKRGAEREQAQNWDAARADFLQANELVPDAETGFAVARTHTAAGDEAAAVEAVEKAAALIETDDENAQKTFVQLREEAVIKAAMAGDFALADRYLKIFPPGSGGDPWYTLQLRVAREQARRKEIDAAIARVEPLLGPDHEESMPEQRREPFKQFLTQMYRTRGASLMHAGKPAEADQWFNKAMELSPENNSLKLLRALAFAGQGRLDDGLRIAASLPSSTKGRDEIEAILYSMKVHKLLESDEFEAAKDALTQAQASSYEAPEVHVAAAAVLAATPVEKLSRKDAKSIKRYSPIEYPDGEVNRYGEALSELAWAREQAKSQGESYPYRGPDFSQRAQSLESRIRAFYPYEVAFNENSTAILELSSSGGGKDVSVRGPNGFNDSAFVAASKQVEVTIQQPGLVTLTIGKQRVVLYTEPYTRLRIKL